MHRSHGPAGAGQTPELQGEKIDIVDYDEDPVAFIAAALSPARVVGVDIVDEGRAGGPGDRAGLPAVLGDRKEGQNARLAARLTGWRLDIHPDGG